MEKYQKNAAKMWKIALLVSILMIYLRKKSKKSHNLLNNKSNSKYKTIMIILIIQI